jgi:hypothetical protein
MNAHARTVAAETTLAAPDLAWRVPSALRSCSPAGAVTVSRSPVPTPSPSSPSPTPPGLDMKAMLGDIAHGFWSAITHLPWWVGAFFAVVVLSAIVRSMRAAIHGGHPRDTVRRFSQAERRMIFIRAGNRCEHYFPLFGRCRTTTALQADHVHPHSRGGWTSVSNGQALCRRHNREKSARVPWNWQLNNLAKRRATYFVPGHEPVVVRHRPPAPRPSRSAAPATQEHLPIEAGPDAAMPNRGRPG